jgi:2-polyprenyl-3-methyl-5-hydroxy-6-metoxy-1,4-benzoquinol methylase
MTADDQITQAASGPAEVARSSRGLRAFARWVARRVARPLLRRRSHEAATAATIAHLQAELEHVRSRHGEQIARLEDLAREFVLSAESLRRVAEGADATASWARTNVEPIAAELYALPYMADSPFAPVSTPVGEALGFRAPVPAGAGDSDYVAFEDVFRGPRDRVAESQLAYVGLVREHAPVLDVGCGRGELLGLLAAAGVPARGVDSDTGMVARCLALGLDATLGEANEHLEGLADGSLGTIFSAQVIEHLPYPELRRLLGLARRKLRPGGLFIAETVNPHRISSLKTFWVDLTHQHPIFPEVALASVAIAGFESGYVFAPGWASFEEARFASPAYAVVASTSGPGATPTGEPGTDAPETGASDAASGES